MCTIGAVFSQGQIITFKQCDLVPTVVFNDPEKRPGAGGVESYLAFTRGPQHGRMWAGSNSSGVGFVAADAYTNTRYDAPDDQTDALFAAYEDSLRRGLTAMDAASIVTDFYLGRQSGVPFPAPDICLHTGWEDEERTRPIAIFTEYTPGPCNQSAVRQIIRRDGFFVSTNHFRIQPDAVEYRDNHSTYLRLGRAEAILQQNPTLEGVLRVLRDQYYGETELSICRETAYPGQEFRTQATAVLIAAPTGSRCLYQINGNPIDNPLRGLLSMTKTVVDRSWHDPIVPPRASFKYVDQGNYAILPLFNEQGINTIYSDSATSCIIVAAVGTLLDGRPGVSLAHLDSPQCIAAYVSLLQDTFHPGVQVFAQGANPPDNETSQANASALEFALKAAGGFIGSSELYLLEGDPRDCNRGDWGVVIGSQGDIVVTSQPYTLTLTDRDPTCGAQSIYCIMRRQEVPPVQLRDAMRPFTLDEIVQLAGIALGFRKDKQDPASAFTNIINLTNDQILDSWSTTPQFEAPWFADQLKQASSFAIAMAPIFSLSGLSLGDVIATPGTRSGSHEAPTLRIPLVRSRLFQPSSLN